MARCHWLEQPESRNPIGLSFSNSSDVYPPLESKGLEIEILRGRSDLKQIGPCLDHSGHFLCIPSPRQKKGQQ